MKREQKNSKSKKDTATEDYLTNRVMAVFLASIVLLGGLTYLWKAYDIGSTYFTAVKINSVLNWVASAAVVGSLIWLASDIKKGKTGKQTIFNGSMATLFSAVVLFSLLLTKYNPVSAKRVLYVVIPAVAILHLIYCSYQREFFFLCLTQSAIALAMWIISRTANRTLSLVSLCGVFAVCLISLFLFLKAQKNGGILKVWDLSIRVIDGEIKAPFVVTVYTAIAMIALTGFLLGAPWSYYALYVLAALMLCEGVYFTVKLI